ncbi:MAG: hypothetical protein V7785_21700 [Bermanella sp.]
MLTVASNWTYSHDGLRHQLKEISQEIEEATSINDNHHVVALKLDRAHLHFRNRNYLEAERELEPILNGDSKNLNALFLMAKIKFALGNLTSAKKFAHVFDRSSKKIASRVRAASLLASIYKSELDAKQAIKYSEFIIENKIKLLPEDVLHAAEVALSLDNKPKVRALAVISKGVSRIGKIHSLIKASIEIMVELSYYRQAITSVDFLIDESKGVYKAILMKKKISILDAQDNRKEAKIIAQKLMTFLDSLPEKKKSLSVVTDLRGVIWKRVSQK